MTSGGLLVAGVAAPTPGKPALKRFAGKVALVTGATSGMVPSQRVSWPWLVLT